MPRTIFVDMDGVTADFDGHYAATIGPLPDRNDPSRDIDWSKIADIDFFLTMPPMPDAHELWDFLGRLTVPKVILTGCPTTGRERAERNKRAWAARQPFIPRGTEVRTVLSKEKFHHCHHGDILIDDWEKYRNLWLAAGGIWITHVNAETTIDRLLGLGLGL